MIELCMVFYTLSVSEFSWLLFTLSFHLHSRESADGLAYELIAESTNEPNFLLLSLGGMLLNRAYTRRTKLNKVRPKLVFDELMSTAAAQSVGKQIRLRRTNTSLEQSNEML